MTVAAEKDRPLLTYCRLGKDRTGLMTALVLSTCGATEDEIVSDYARRAAQLLAHALNVRLIATVRVRVRVGGSFGLWSIVGLGGRLYGLYMGHGQDVRPPRRTEILSLVL